MNEILVVVFVQTMVEELDPNGKGEITLEKFLSMMEKTINDDMERMFKGMFRMTDTVSVWKITSFLSFSSHILFLTFVMRKHLAGLP